MSRISASGSQRTWPGIAFIFTEENGDQTEVRVAAVPVRDGGGRIAGALAAVYDMTMLVDDAASSALTLMLAEEEGRQSSSATAERNTD